ncbi:exodeoxyribonuclease VII large subunit [Avibacterium paragallinarum]|uniref:exodeoxyribonuclease VII large subunit n=1 Tax=Avibacterium paragallinarum TaxID=728 RepID=UPI00102A98A3|nr:exodeoxyribonuclease VII large subunit [Avibacterium paragallinarum]RZN58931.1 exodeoxyribonuclease VII large subunit [Avibacterium paragallinarum]TID28742.1 exodeoxyribonuclease VII large subunit [Avibacterium paragallinarum]
MENSAIYSVSQLNQQARRLLEGQLGSVWLTGEISNFTQPVSGHWYLTLKDENAQVRCAMFRMKNLRVAFRPQNGMQVLVRASVSLYEPRGDYQLIIETMHPAGEGLLQQQFEALKMKLAAEGLFAQNLKKNLPHFCRKVGVITSPTGAALQDILHILQRRDPSLNVIIYPTAVQGQEATAEIVQMIELANCRQEVDVLIVGRGGGSLEDLWCFNEEAVARAIFHSAIPVISAVGHETDVTIADFVADVRAPTPSAAAELVSRDQQELIRQLNEKCQRLEMALDRLFNEKSQWLNQLQLRLQNRHPQIQLNQQKSHLAQLNYRLQFAIQRNVDRKAQGFATQRQHLATAITQFIANKKQPLHQLERQLHSRHPQKQLNQQKAQIQQQGYDLQLAMQRYLTKTQQNLTALCERLNNNPLPYQMQKHSQHLQQLQVRLDFAIEKKLSQKQNHFAQLCQRLDGLSPLKILSRGYSISENEKGIAITQCHQVKVGEILKTRLANGMLISRVEHIKEEMKA